MIHQEINDQKDKLVSLRDELKQKEKDQKLFISRLVEEEKELASKEDDIRKRIEEEVRLREEAQRELERQAAEEARREEARRAEEAARKEAEKTNSRNNNEDSSNNDNKSESDASWQTFEATAYTAYCEGCTGVTRLGIDLRSNPNAKVIAVDPSVIPLGKRVEIRGHGTFLAADIGSAIIGNKIDIFMPNQSDALSFGRRNVQLRVLD
nr:3D domain-containing protein [Bacillus alkalicola]